jgi:protein-disulfide isomerase
VVVAVAVLVAGAFVAVSAVQGDSSTTPRPTSPTSAENSLFAGIQQHGIVLGSPNAPVTLVEFADLQCPYCGEFARNALPQIVRDYVRTGRVKVAFQGLAFLGHSRRLPYGPCSRQVDRVVPGTSWTVSTPGREPRTAAG